MAPRCEERRAVGSRRVGREPKRTPRKPKRAPRCAQDSPIMALKGPTMTPRGPDAKKDIRSYGQEGAASKMLKKQRKNTDFGGSETPQKPPNEAKMAPRWA